MTDLGAFAHLVPAQRGVCADGSGGMAGRDEPELSAARLAALIASSADIIALLDDEGRLIDANPAAEQILGLRAADFVGSDMLDLIHPDDLRAVLESLANARTIPGLQPAVQFRVRAAGGAWITLSSRANNQLANPSVRGIVINARNVTAEVGQLDALVLALIKTTEFRDPYTAGHQAEVARMSRRVSVTLGLPSVEVTRIALGASLHDIGKVSVPSDILTKPGRLNAPEWEIMKHHTVVGHEILSDVALAQPILDIVRHHHERLDGSGYPDAIAGDEIFIGARIVAVCDVIDAMSSHRPYRPALGLKAAVTEIRNHSGTKYDSDVVNAALTVITEERSPETAFTTPRPSD